MGKKQKKQNVQTVFIGCAKSQREVASAIQMNLSDSYETEIWDQGTFKLGRSNIDNLISSGKKFDFAILVTTPDDIIIKSGQKLLAPRDNIIFEMGFFIGLLGLERTFIVCEDRPGLKMPSDMDGIVTARFRKPEKTSLQSALSPACNKIKDVASRVPGFDFEASQKTPDDAWTNNLVQGALKVVCNALETPLATLDSAKLRAFIFKKESANLVCTHYWALRKTREAVNVLKFKINKETSKQVAVVRAAIMEEVVATKVKPLKGIKANVDENLCFVLAAPIIGPYGEVWGTVDIDASSKEGEKLLTQNGVKEVLFELGRHLYLALTSKKNDLHFKTRR